MPQQNSVISLDPIDRKKRTGPLQRLLVTRWYKGKPVEKSEPYGHYMFCGSQGSGKSVSVLWYAEQIAKRYKRRKIKYWSDEKQKYVKFKTPPRVKLYSNVDIGRHIDKKKIYETVDAFDPYANEVRIVVIDEVHTYFPRGSVDKETQKIRDDLTSLFSQLRKRNTYILSTAQIYGRLDKSLREQCLFMIDCKVNLNGKIVNDFILEKDILCDDLGRWAGNPKYIKVHGLPELVYDSKKIIRE